MEILRSKGNALLFLLNRTSPESRGGGQVNVLEIVKRETEAGLLMGRTVADDFFSGLSSETRSAFQSLATLSHCSCDTVLFTGGQPLNSVLFLLEGRTKLWLDCSGGRRIALGVFGSGEILGLASVVSGCANGITAEAESQCFIASVRREAFLDFLECNPVACRNVARLLNQEYYRCYDRIRSYSFSFPD